jgi:regulator of nonsense transcripts 3
LSQKVQSSTWEDARETYNDPALISAPTVEFAIYKKIPSEKKRVDPRQGTIDQDPEFMAFLEALANPDASREAEADQGEENGKLDKTTTTPLVEYLREKKAAKAKEVAALKSAKHARQDSQGVKGKTAPAPTEEPKKRSRDGRAEKERATEKAPERTSDRPRESVKILTKKAAAAAEAAEAAKAVAAQIQPSTLSSSQAGGQEPQSKSRRAGIAAAARILQRDLGLSPGNAHRKARQEAAKGPEVKGTATKETVAPAAPEPAPPPEPPAPPAPAKTQPAASGRSRNRKRGAGEDSVRAKGEANGEKAVEPATPAPPKAPITMLKKKDSQRGQSPQPPSAAAPAPAGPSKATPPAQPANITPPSGPKSAAQKQAGGSKKANAPATPSPGATRAFIKHANHSQGVTDALLKEALQAFGTVTSVEIDRKKGFAYVDFDGPSGLVKAMAASPVTVAQATVQVLERKEMGKKGPGSGAGQGKNAGASASTPAPAAAPPKVQTPAPAAVEHSSAPSTPVSAGPATEKTGEQQSKRGGRRRGGRGRGDKDPKEAKEPLKDGGAKKQDGGSGSATPAAG